MRRADLERLLDQVPDHPAPDPDLEQYRTPAAVAADLLLDARDAGDVAGRRVLDLGCGTGVLAIGAAALGAGHVLGVDVDAASVGLAQSAAARLVPGRSVAFEAADVAQWRPAPGEAPFDTVVMNPPFGAQRANRRADRVFYERALAAAPGGAVWFLAPHVSERFLSAFAAERGMRLERTRSWAYPLPARFGFHREAVRTMAVGGYCLRGVGA